MALSYIGQWGDVLPSLCGLWLDEIILSEATTAQACLQYTNAVHCAATKHILCPLTNPKNLSTVRLVSSTLCFSCPCTHTVRSLCFSGDTSATPAMLARAKSERGTKKGEYALSEMGVADCERERKLTANKLVT